MTLIINHRINKMLNDSVMERIMRGSSKNVLTGILLLKLT
jgi:hypothetical protein